MIDIRKNWHNIVFAITGIVVGYDIYTSTRLIVNEYWQWLNGLALFCFIFGVVNAVLIFKKKDNIK